MNIKRINLSFEMESRLQMEEAKSYLKMELKMKIGANIGLITIAEKS